MQHQSLLVKRRLDSPCWGKPVYQPCLAIHNISFSFVNYNNNKNNNSYHSFNNNMKTKCNSYKASSILHKNNQVLTKSNLPHL